MKKILLFLLLMVVLTVCSAFGAPTYRYSDVVQTVRGDAVSAASATVYLANTVTKATLYSGTTDASTALTNPVYSDSYGRFYFYAIPGTYDIVISGSNVTSHTTEDVVVAPSFYDEFNVKAYGAKGDGVTDDTAAIQAAIDAVKSISVVLEYGTGHPNQQKPAALVFPDGIYLIKDTLWFGITALQYKENACTIVKGSGAVILGQTSGKPMADFSGASDVSVDGLTFQGSTTNTPNIGILLSRVGTDAVNASAGKHRFQDVTVFGTFTISAVYWYASEVNSWTNCEIHNKGGICAIYMTSNNAKQAITSANAAIDTTYQSSYGDTFVNTNIRWYGADSSADTTRAVIIVESLSYGPKFYDCYFNALRTAVTPAPIIRAIAAQGETGTSANTQGLSLVGCTFEEGASSWLSIENKLINLEIQGCSGGTVQSGNDIEITASGECLAYNIQRDRGGTSVSELVINNLGTLDNRTTGLGNTDDLDDFLYSGTWSWSTSIPSNAPSSDNYKIIDVVDGALGTDTHQMVWGGEGSGSSYSRWHNGSSWSSWKKESREYEGTGSPEGVVTAPAGSTYNRTDGALGTSFYVKVSGTGNTGWRSLLPGSVVTATADDVTPTVLSTVVLVLSDNTVATAITQLDGGGAGQEVTLICTATANTPTIADSGNFTLSAAWAPNAGDTISLVTTNGTLWYEKSRSSN